ncbi:hypothetical protein CVT24_003693 [Panaeolus cyanescens]|uniref:F-box domain-containing protein n=1 Tax=Panaeolus cyanescens TaxID=181874 RepID=A0A409VUL5_9AGAR|nr:hypothetical protein CVT24_003693 [Panaeolus cyanescens]
MEGTEPQTPSCISVLPQDVLLEILFLVRDFYSEQHKTEFCHDAAAVSSSWRELLHSTPLWWNDLYVPFPTNLDLIRRHLTLGKETTLRLELSEPDVISAASDLVDLITPHLKRCWYLSFEGEVDDDTAFHLTGSILSHPDLLLRHLTFNITGGTSEEVNITTLFPTWKALATLRLGGSIITHLKSPMPQITRLHLSRGYEREKISFPTFGKILLLCPSLTLLALYDDILSYHSDVADQHITHTHLESILILGNMLNASEFLVYVDAPNLRELVIAPVVAGDFRRLEDLPLSACQNKFQSLTKLTLGPAYRQALTRCHKASHYFPNVETLVFANVYPIQFKKMFTRMPELFPNMKHLGVTGVRDAFLPIVLDLAEMRKEQFEGVAVRLERLSIDSESYEDMRSVVERNEERLGRLGLEVVCADLWEEQRLEAMHNKSKGLFVGRSEPDTDSDTDET